MHRHARDFVRALLPLIPLAFITGCGGGGSGSGPSSPSANAHRKLRRPVSTMRRRFPLLRPRSPRSVRFTTINRPASDPDGDALHFSANNLPPWASMDPTNGHISGTPGENDLGVYESITISVADAARETVSPPFSITVVGDATSGRGFAAMGKAAVQGGWLAARRPRRISHPLWSQQRRSRSAAC